MIETSQSWNPGPLKIFRPIVPNVPMAGGIITDAPFMKHPYVWSDVSMADVVAFAMHAAGRDVPGKYGIGVCELLKSEVFPKKSHRSLFSPVRLISSPVSMMFHGWAVCSVRMELTCHPSRS